MSGNQWSRKVKEWIVVKYSRKVEDLKEWIEMANNTLLMTSDTAVSVSVEDRW